MDDESLLRRKLAMVRRVIMQSETLVIWFRYRDSKGKETMRVVSPYRVFNETRFSGLCLLREEARQFDLRRCDELRIGLAADIVMPVEISGSECIRRS
jgi:predicted DNA-binding transcriptional regulator YafY